MTSDMTNISRAHELADYRQYYGLSRDPFQDSPPTPFYGGGERFQLLEKLQHLCQFSASLLAVLGGPGTGKTRLAAELLSGFEGENDLSAVRAKPGCTAAQVFTQIVSDLRLLTEPEASVGQLLATLRRFGQSADELDSLALVLIDDAHHLDEQTLASLLTLLQGQDPGGRRLHLVLFAEPQLGDRLSQLEMHGVLVHELYLEPLGLPEAVDYLNFRMESAGYLGPELFNESLAEPWWHRADGSLPVLHQHAHQWLLESVAAPSAKGSFRLPALNISNLTNFSNLPKLLKTPNLSNLPVMHLVAIAALLGVLMMLFFYRGSGTTERRELEAEMVFVADRPAPASVTLPQAQRPIAEPEPPAVPSESAQAASDSITTSPAQDTTPMPEPVIPEPAQPEPTQPKPEVPESPAPTPQVTQQAQPEPAPASPNTTQRLPEDEQILLSWRPGDYTLQLLGAGSEQAVRDFVASQPNREQLLRFTTRRQGKDWFVVVAGRYSSIEQARAAIAALPAHQREAGPWPRVLKDIQEEIEGFRQM